MEHQNRIALFVAAVAVLLVSSAQAVVADPMSCEAKVLATESRYYRCLARCDRKSAANERFDVERCEERCRNSMEKSVQRIENKPRCRPPTPDPNLCEARLLKIESQHLSCQSRCDRKERRSPEFDEVTCAATCDAAADQGTTATLADVLCAAGRVNGDPE